MIPSRRQEFNHDFTSEKYQAFLNDLDSRHPGAIEFRVAETPVFLPRSFTNQMLEACESIIDFITDPNFKEITQRSIPDDDRVANEKGICHMIAFDFGVCRGENGQFVPQLIEMQGFPSLLGFQAYLAQTYQKNYSIPESYTPFLDGLTHLQYLQFAEEVILGGLPPEQVILLEIKPHQQKTRIDFYCTQEYWGIQPVCLTELIQEGRELYYMREGVKTRILRIYNRVIFDELHAKKEELGNFVDIRQDFDVEWITHPNWFYRISKFTLPFIRSPYVPETFFLNEIKQLPEDLRKYVLKPLFSFAGQGVVIDVEQQHIDAINDPENWILQKKVEYAPAIQTPNEPAKVEIRILYLWNPAEVRPRPVINLCRLSKGKMIGVRYNQDKDWVGGSVAFIEPPSA